MADLKKDIKRIKWGGIKIREERTYSLAYADDMVLVAEGEDEMRSVIERLEIYLDKKKLDLNVDKTKIMRFRKRGGRMEKSNWKWKGNTIEEVKEFKYLGYILERNGGQEAHIRDRIKKATTIMGQIWEKKICRGLGKEALVIRQVSVDGYELWGRSMGMEGKGGNRESRRKVFKMGIRGR